MIVGICLLTEVKGKFGKVGKLERKNRMQNGFVKLGRIENEVPEIAGFFFREAVDIGRVLLNKALEVGSAESGSFKELPEDAVEPDDCVLKVWPGFPFEVEGFVEIKDYQ